MSWTGGLQEYVAGLSRGLDEIGHEVRILTGGVGPPAGPPANALAEGLDLRWHPVRRILGRYAYPEGIALAIREHANGWADVVHVHQPFFVGTWLATFCRAPVVANFHLHPEHLSGPSARRRRALLRILIGRVESVASVSQAEGALVRGVRRPGREVVVWPAIEAASRGRQGVAERSRPLVIYVGRLSATKGIELALRGLALIAGQCDVRVVGDGPDRSRCEELCRELGLDPQEIMLGSLTDDEVLAMYRTASVFVSMSSQEAFGIALLKAIACGCKPVVSDISSHREIIQTVGVDEDKSLLQLPTSPHELALAIERAISATPAIVNLDAIPTWGDSAAAMAREYEAIVRRW
jgi:glycosyltransferase involved in cell wall biosynthesis